MQCRNDGGDLPTHAEAHSEMGCQGILAAVEKYRLAMQLQNDGGELPTFEEAQSEMSCQAGRQGKITQVEETRIATQEHVGGVITNENAQSVHHAIIGTGNSGKPRGESTQS